MFTGVVSGVALLFVLPPGLALPTSDLAPVLLPTPVRLLFGGVYGADVDVCSVRVCCPGTQVGSKVFFFLSFLPGPTRAGPCADLFSGDFYLRLRCEPFPSGTF